ncbi:MAG: hypothetical protein AB1430_18750 [Pseudomonadota bacterium]
MLEFFIALFVLLVLLVTAFLLWCAYQLGWNGRHDLARLWVPRAPAEVETLAPLFARRDLALAAGCALFIVLALWQPQRFAIWFLLLAVCIGAYYGFTRYAVLKLPKPGAARPSA